MPDGQWPLQQERKQLYGLVGKATCAPDFVQSFRTLLHTRSASVLEAATAAEAEDGRHVARNVEKSIA